MARLVDRGGICRPTERPSCSMSGAKGSARLPSSTRGRWTARTRSASVPERPLRSRQTDSGRWRPETSPPQLVLLPTAPVRAAAARLPAES